MMKAGVREERVASERREAGWQVLAMVMATAIVSYGAVSLATASAMGQVQIRRAAERAVLATACQTRLMDAPPDREGGAIAPERPRRGWTDVVYAFGQECELRQLADGERAPEGAVVVRRQWRVRETGTGSLLEVSAELANPDGSRHGRASSSVRHARRDLR